MDNVTPRDDILGVILAGGQARRMGGGDKCLLELAGQPILTHLRTRLEPQLGHLVLNANGDGQRFGQDLIVVPDTMDDHPGPLAGVLSGLDYLRTHHPEMKGMISLPGDTPFLPHDLVTRLMLPIDAGQAQLSCAASEGRRHPVVGFWPAGLADDLRDALSSGMRKIDRFTASYKMEVVNFPSSSGIDPFFNINTPEEQAHATKLLS